jgi:hypothetical protein
MDKDYRDALISLDIMKNINYVRNNKINISIIETICKDRLVYVKYCKVFNMIPNKDCINNTIPYYIYYLYYNIKEFFSL